MTNKAMKTDIAKLKARIGRRQRWCDAADKREDPDMVRMYKNDIRDLTTILKMISKRDFKGAWSRLYVLDTSVRDDVPARLYNFLAKKNGCI